MSQLLTHCLDTQTPGHGLLGERKRDVGTAVVVVTGAGVTFGGWWGGGEALPLTQTRPDKTLLLPDWYTALTRPTPGPATSAASTFDPAADPARLRTTPHPGTHHLPIKTLTGVAVLIPLSSFRGQTTVHRARPLCHFLTAWSSSVLGTQAAIAIDLINTAGTKDTGRRLALVDIDPAVWPSEAWSTFTSIPVITIYTGPTVITWVWVAVVGILFTGVSLPALLADAGEGVPAGHTGSPVLTGVRKTAAILSYITGSPLPSRGTLALEGVSLIMTCPSIVTGNLVTLALTGVAGLPLPAVHTLTEEISHQVSTCSSIMAWTSAAVIYIGLTVVPLPAVSTDTLVYTDFIYTGSSVTTRVALTIINILVTVCASEALLTVTAELSSSLAPTASVRPTHVGGDVPLPSRGTVGSHGNRAAVNHFARAGVTVVFEVRAVFPFVVV